MAVTVGMEQDMQGFVRGLFQESPDLSILTHAIVRKKYLAHVGQETLTKEEKEQLKRLVEKELVQMQVDDSPSMTELQTSVRSGGQKRRLCASDTSGDEVKSKPEQKKQRTGKELEVSSDEQDSGIDSKKIPVCSSSRPAGKFSCTLNQGDSGAEDHSDGSGRNRQHAETKSREAVGRKATQEQQSGRQRGRSGSESEETEDGQGSDLEEETRGRKKATEGQRTESDVEQELRDCKLQKKRQKWTGSLGKKGKMNKEKRRKESESEEEENERLQVGKMRAKKTVDWRDNEEEKEEGGNQKTEIGTRQRTRKAQEESESWDESGDDSEEENRMRKKVTNNKYRRKSVKVEELETASRMRKETPKTKTRRAGEEKRGLKLESNSEDEEEPERQIGKGGMTKTQRKNVSRRELEEEQGDREKRHNPEKQHGMRKPKRSVSSSDESEREMDERKGFHHKKEGIRKFSSEGDESQSEAEEGRRGKSQSRQAPVNSNESESGSEKSELGDRRKKRMIKKRSKDVSGSEDEKSKDKETEKSQKESVSEMESEEESEDSGSELVGKKKCEGQQKKGTPTPRRRSKEASENESVEEKGGSSSEDNPHSSKQRHRGKDREHSGKNEDHPSIQRLKRYIRECGVHRNYKKLLAGCRSRRAQVEVLKKELESIGLKGTPSLAKCRVLKKKREEAAEVASLDLSNIIATEGRPRRRNVWSLYSKPQESPSSPEESPICRPATDWSRLRGVISSDGESN